MLALLCFYVLLLLQLHYLFLWKCVIYCSYLSLFLIISFCVCVCFLFLFPYPPPLFLFLIISFCVSLSLTHKKEIIRSQGNLSSLSLALEKLPLKMDRGPLVQPPLPLLFLTSFRIHISRNSFYNTARVGVMRCCSVPVAV